MYKGMASAIEKYLSYGRMNLKRQFIYRMEFMFSIIISPISLLVSYFIWRAIYANAEGATILGYSFSDMILYYVAAMIINHAIFNTVGVDLQNKIMDGSLSADLLKPISTFSIMLTETLTNRALAFVLEVIPVFIISWIIFRFTMPGPALFALFLVSLFLSVVLNFMINLLIGMLAFWMTNVRSLQWLGFLVIRFFSGEFIPLDFLGRTFLAVSAFLPFQYIRYQVIGIFLGKMGIGGALIVIGAQVLWIAALLVVFHFVWKKALIQFGAVGG